MKFYIISEEEIISKGIELDDVEEVFDYTSVETMIDDLEYLYGNIYQFTEEILEKAKEYVIYKMDNPYNTELVIDHLIHKGILS